MREHAVARHSFGEDAPKNIRRAGSTRTSEKIRGGPDRGRARIASVNKADITPALVARLVAAQFPQWAHLPVMPVELDGWDNTTVRLGHEYSVRLPSGDEYLAQVEKEHRWLPILGAQLPLPIPEPLAKGRPGCGFPRPWSIYRWLEGEPAGIERIADLTQFATDLAGFLAALYAIDPTDGPPPGTHNFSRGGPITTYAAQTRQSIALLADEIDAQAATDVWEAAITGLWDRAPVWVHGDVAASKRSRRP